jgi:hypothetical protein
MSDTHPDAMQERYNADPNYRNKEVFVQIPGKHRNKEAAWKALRDMLAIRH